MAGIASAASESRKTIASSIRRLPRSKAPGDSTLAPASTSEHEPDTSQPSSSTPGREDAVYGSGPDECDIYYRLHYRIDQEPLTSIRHVRVRFQSKFWYSHALRVASVAILLDDCKRQSRYLDYIWEGRYTSKDGYPFFIMHITRHHRYHYVDDGLPFPASDPNNPLEASVGPPDGLWSKG